MDEVAYLKYINYHLGGDASVEERLCANITKHLKLNEWDTFRFIYLYCTCYHLPSVMKWMKNPLIDWEELTFRTDRKYVRANKAYPRMICELTKEKMETLKNIHTSQEAYDFVTSWFFFGRYAAFLFLEVYYNRYPERLTECNLKMGWEAKENYTNGAKIISRSDDRKALDSVMKRIMRDSGDNEFVIETSLCAEYKIHKKHLNRAYCRERLFNIYQDSEYAPLFFSLVD